MCFRLLIFQILISWRAPIRAQYVFQIMNTLESSIGPKICFRYQLLFQAKVLLQKLNSGGKHGTKNRVCATKHDSSCTYMRYIASPSQSISKKANEGKGVNCDNASSMDKKRSFLMRSSKLGSVFKPSSLGTYLISKGTASSTWAGNQH